MPTMHNNVLSWASDIDQATLDQAALTAALPFVSGHVALMPDAHRGLGATIGSVVPTDGAIIPAAVGVDIGCGMIAVETTATSNALPDSLGPLHGSIRSLIPAGVGKGHILSDADERSAQAARIPTYTGSTPLSERQTSKTISQFGTLGSGNHFVEVCLDERDVVWLVLHSGSRGIGNELAQTHIGRARGIMKTYFVDLPDPDLAYLAEGTPEFTDYIRDMLWAQDYAFANREAMMDAALAALAAISGASEVQRINCHHNYTTQEHHNGANVWLTRKGAIRARSGDLGVIPGSMGTSSYIVRGLGNAASYHSCSHGAGRRMSRTRARKELTVESLNEKMAGRAWNDRQAKELLDEHPDAYKDIDQVMADQADLVEVVHTLHQILNYKGA